MADRATVFILSAISPEVLAVFNAPVDPGPLEQLLGSGFLYPETGHQIGDLDGFLDDLSLANGLDASSDPDELSCSSQTDCGRIYGDAPELTLFNPAVVFIDTLSLRGERRRAAIARL